MASAGPSELASEWLGSGNIQSANGFWTASASRAPTGGGGSGGSSAGGGGGLPGAGTNPSALSENAAPATTSGSGHASNGSSTTSGTSSHNGPSSGGFSVDPSRLGRGAQDLGSAGQTTSTVALLGMTFPSLGSAFQNGFNQALTASQASVEALTRFVEMSRLKLIEAILEYLAVESGNSALFSAGSGTGGSGQGQASGTPLGAG